jgi:hypothetical protein
MKLKLISHSPKIETLIATSMLTTTSGAMPSTLFYSLLEKPEKVHGLVSRVEVQHGNILEHNRFVWKLETSKEKILNILLKKKFFNITRVGKSTWLLSSNLRTLVEYHNIHKDDFSDLMVESIKNASPQLYDKIRRNEK